MFKNIQPCSRIGTKIIPYMLAMALFCTVPGTVQAQTSDCKNISTSLMKDAETATVEKWQSIIEDNLTALNGVVAFYQTKATAPNLHKDFGAELSLAKQSLALLVDVMDLYKSGEQKQADEKYRVYLKELALAENASRCAEREIRDGISKGLKPYYDTNSRYTEVQWEEVRKTVGGKISGDLITALIKPYMINPSDYTAFQRMQQNLRELRKGEIELFYGELTYNTLTLTVRKGGYFAAAFKYGHLLRHFAKDHEKAVNVLYHPATFAVENPNYYPNTSALTEPLADLLGSVIASGQEAKYPKAAKYFDASLQSDIGSTDKGVGVAKYDTPTGKIIRSNVRKEKAKLAWEYGLNKKAVELAREALEILGDDFLPDKARELRDMITLYSK